MPDPRPDHAAARYELSLFVGPCTEDEATALAEKIMELTAFKAVYGGAVGITRQLEDESDA